MLCLPLALVLLAQVTHPIRTAYVTSSPLVATLDRIFEKLERLTVAPTPSSSTPKTILSDDEEEILSAMQMWGGLTPDQLDRVAKDLQRMRAEDVRAVRLTDLEYADMDMDNDEEYTDIEYHNDGKEDEDDDEAVDQRFVSDSTSVKVVKYRARGDLEDDESTSQRPRVIPSEMTREGPYRRIVSAVASIAATNERPRVLDDSGLTAVDRNALHRAALENIGRVVRESRCLVPQPRWLSVRQLAPASDTMFTPPCVQLYRCAPDSGCCNRETEVCAPIEGQYVTIPFYLHKAEGSSRVARMVFFNHTTCACVSRDTLQTSLPVPRPVVTQSVVTHAVMTPAPNSEERQNDERPLSGQATIEPTLEEDVTAPSQIRRCTCPTNFQATMSNGACSCGCGWREPTRRRDCLYFSRGKEHLGLRDRECIEDKVCAPPVCDYGAYDRMKGKCPKSKKRFHDKRHHQERNVV